jgi:hypothetical protein
MPGRAAGLRARLSAAEAVALPCAKAQMPEAKAMENPAAIATQLTPLSPPPCAKAGTAKDSTDNTINNLLSLLIVFLLVLKYRQWVVDVIPCRRPHAKRLVSKFSFLVSSFDFRPSSRQWKLESETKKLNL